MNKFYIAFMLAAITCCFSISSYAQSPNFCWKAEYQKSVLRKVGAQLPDLVTFPFYKYPNTGHEDIEKRFPSGKILVFGYGSLMNKESAGRTLSPEAVASMQTAVAFGVKRVFNYKAVKTSHWGENQDKKEKAMLNLVQTLNISSIANGVVIEVDVEDFSKLVSRETGYDLVPILVASWDDMINEKEDLEIRVAYTFVAVNELRDHVDYTSTEFYPVRGYLHAIQDTAKTYDDRFAQLWNLTTYLADGTTGVNDWDEVTFQGILCTKQP